jgi:predicted ribonuclease YlaK
VSAELDQRVTAFDEAIKALDQQIARWSMLAEFVVPDTSVYIGHPQKLEELDIAPLLPVRHEDIHVLVPIIIVDELDGLKQSKDPAIRWRAGYTLAVLDRVFDRTTGPIRLRAADSSALDSGGIPRGEITIELVFDPPGHIRLPINDDEIIDRAKAVEPLAGRQVRLLTYDSGQSMRARAQGLRAVKLSKPIGEEPKDKDRS